MWQCLGQWSNFSSAHSLEWNFNFLKNKSFSFLNEKERHTRHSEIRSGSKTISVNKNKSSLRILWNLLIREQFKRSKKMKSCLGKKFIGKFGILIWDCMSLFLSCCFLVVLFTHIRLSYSINFQNRRQQNERKKLKIKQKNVLGLEACSICGLKEQ